MTKRKAKERKKNNNKSRQRKKTENEETKEKKNECFLVIIRLNEILDSYLDVVE